MSPFQDDYDKPDPAGPPIAKIVRINRPPLSSPNLELQASIGGRDQIVVLPLDALEGHGLSGPVAVEELRAIRSALEELVRAVKNGSGKEQRSMPIRLTPIPTTCRAAMKCVTPTPPPR